jgi:hypothetical protein
MQPPDATPTIETTPAAEPAPRRRRVGLLGVSIAVVAVVAVTLALTLTLASGGSSSGFTLRGTLELNDPSGVGGTTNCRGFGGYSDITEGAQVLVTDASGKVIALGALGAGNGSGGSECDFTFTVNNVPTGDGTYGVEVTHRGVIYYSEDDAKAGVGLTLGGS